MGAMTLSAPRLVAGPKVRVGLVGAGYIADFSHLPALRAARATDLRAICDLDEARARLIASRWGIPRVYTSLEQMLCDEELDLVDICVPPHQHRAALVTSLERGVHCLVEKPLAVSTSDADEVIDLARQKGLGLYVIHNYSAIPAIPRAKALIAKGAIGEVRGAHINYFVPFAPRHLDPNHWCHSLPGDYFSEVGPHLALLMVEFIGPVREVQAMTLKTTQHPAIRMDELRLMVRSDSAAGTISCSMNCPSRILTVDVVGTEGALHVNCDYQAVVHYRAINSSLNAWSRGMGAVRDIASRTSALIETTGRVLAGQYSLETYGHRELVKSCLAAVQGLGSYPVDTLQAREAVRLLELAFGAPSASPDARAATPIR